MRRKKPLELAVRPPVRMRWEESTQQSPSSRRVVVVAAATSEPELIAAVSSLARSLHVQRRPRAATNGGGPPPRVHAAAGSPAQEALSAASEKENSTPQGTEPQPAAQGASGLVGSAAGALSRCVSIAVDQRIIRSEPPLGRDSTAPTRTQYDSGIRRFLLVARTDRHFSRDQQRCQSTASGGEGIDRRGRIVAYSILADGGAVSTARHSDTSILPTRNSTRGFLGCFSRTYKQQIRRKGLVDGITATIRIERATRVSDWGSQRIRGPATRRASKETGTGPKSVGQATRNDSTATLADGRDLQYS